MKQDSPNYFIIDTHGGKDLKSIYKDRDFIEYNWDKRRYDKIKENDYFIYRRPITASEYKKFYFFGAGRFGPILLDNSSNGKKPVKSQILHGEQFNQKVLSTDKRLLSYSWKFKPGKKQDWRNFFNQYGITQIKKEDYQFLRELGKNGEPNILLEDENVSLIEGLSTFVTKKEGKKVTYFGTRYERNPNLRKITLEHYGYDCQACGFNFEKFYGKELGKEFIEVHHIKPLSEIGRESEINPVEDLIPLCPNCHRMIHRIPGKVLSVAEVKNIITSSQLEN